MALYQLKTFSDIIAAVREELGVASTDTNFVNRIKRDINAVYQELTSEKNWWWLEGHTSLQLPAYISAGTVNVSQGSSSITFSVAPGASQRGKLFAIDGFSEIYTIESHTAGSTDAKLSELYAGSTNTTASYKLWSEKLPLPTDCKETTEIWHDYHTESVEAIGKQEFRRVVLQAPRAEGKPRFYYTGDFIDPVQRGAISSLPSISTRASSGVVKTLVFSNSIPTSIVSDVNSGEPVRWNISGAGHPSYNGDIILSTISTTTNTNDTITYSGKAEHQETMATDTSIVVTNIDQEADYDRYRELYLYPCLNPGRVTLHVDYIKEIFPLENDNDEPVLPMQDRMVLVYGTLHRAWSRIRNAEEAARNLGLYQNKLAKMAGKLQDSTDFPQLMPSKIYLSSKRNITKRLKLSDSNLSGGAGGGGGSSVITGVPNRAAIFDGNGELTSDQNISNTELGYLDGVTSNIQSQIDTITTLSDGMIYLGDTNNVAQEVAPTGDVTISNTGVTAITSDAIVDSDINSSAAIARSKIAPGTASDVLINDGSGVMSSEAQLAISRGGTGQATSSEAFAALAPSPGTPGNVLTSDGSSWTSATPTASPTSSYELSNLGLSASVSGNALTINLKQSDGTDPSSGASAVKIGFRHSTAATGQYVQRSVTSALSMTVSSGSTLGTVSSQTQYVYVYVIDNAGTVELAASGSRLFDEGTLQNTTAEGGAGAADSSGLLYSTTARTGVAVRYIGRIKSTQTTAGTWASSPSEISLNTSYKDKQERSEIWVDTPTGFGSTNTKIKKYSVTRNTIGSAITYTASSTNGDSFTINEDGLYSISMVDTSSTSSQIGASRNSSQLTTNIASITTINRILYTQPVGSSLSAAANTVIYLQTGDIIRPHCDGTASDGGAYNFFRITKVTD